MRFVRNAQLKLRGGKIKKSTISTDGPIDHNSLLHMDDNSQGTEEESERVFLHGIVDDSE